MQNDLNGAMTSNGSGAGGACSSTIPPAQNDLYISPLGMGFGDCIVGDDMDFLNNFLNTWNASP